MSHIKSNFESIVTSLELSQKLKKIGVKQESFFYWWFLARKPDQKAQLRNDNITKDFNDWEYEIYSAFTAQELWDMIEVKSITITKWFHLDSLTLGCHLNKSCSVEQLTQQEKSISYDVTDKSMADCLACFLIEQMSDKND